ncbi:hypothetical protein ABMA28_010720 [Loxostege sticticalis]|uniref:Reverse transcriptase n=1 Tax=Loxostege sticticalis TaxID=481309 RepID=A0ABD0S952_LOXSC
MVLLCPSISALNKLIGICERYAGAHGLRYNTVKSELLVFKAKNKLNGTPLKQVQSFKYLGHWVTESLKDDLDLERERRALCVRANMLVRSLWTDYTQGAFRALRTQYNDVFRVRLGLRRYCSASGMLAEAGVDTFAAIVRKRIASLIHRVNLHVCKNRPRSLQNKKECCNFNTRYPNKLCMPDSRNKL